MSNVNRLFLYIFLAILAGRHLLTFMLAVFLPDKAPQMAPTSAMIPQDSPKIPPRGLKMAPRLVQLPSRWGQDGAKCIKMYKILFQKCHFYKAKLTFLEFSGFRSRLEPILAHHGAELAQEGPQEALRWVQDGLRGFKISEMGPGFGPKTAQDRPEMGSRRAPRGNLMQ